MQAIDPDSRAVKMLMGAASLAGRGYEGARGGYRYLRQNPLVLAAVALLVVAVLLRLFGIM